MREDQYDALMAAENPAKYIEAASFLGADRTLLYGYTCDRESFHVYLSGGLIHRYVYTGTLDHTPISHRAQEKVWAFDLIPDKGVYPESTDYLFAQMLQRLGARVPYLPFDRERRIRVRTLLMHGRTYEEGAQ